MAAAISPTVQGQRILASVERFSWDKILAILRKRDAQRELPEDFSGGDDPNEVHPDADAKTLQLLRDLGIPGWTSLEESIGNQLDSVSG